MSNVRPMIRSLTNYVSQLAQETQTNLNGITREINDIKEILSAVTKAVGEEAVQAALASIMEKRIKDDEAAQVKAIEILKEGGIFLPIEAVEGDCCIVGTDTTKDGKVRQVRMELDRLSPVGRDAFTGKKVGDKIEDETTFEVTAIYRIDREAAKTRAAAEKAAVAEAPAVEAMQ